MIQIGSIKFTNTNKLAEDLSYHISKGRISFEIPIQRGYVWDRSKKSAFILNMIEGGPTFPIYVNKINGIDYVIDGQQRGRTSNSYIENKFALSKLPSIITSQGEIIDISGKKFKDLPEEFKKAILEYNFEYNFGENLTEEQVKTVFIRLNSGKPLSTTEMTKAQIKSVADVMSLSQHEIFKKLMSEKSIEASKNTSLVMQTYVALFEPYKCMLSSSIKKALQDIQITSEQQEQIKRCFDIFNQIYNELSQDKSDISKRLIVILKRKSHFVALMYTINEAIIADDFSLSVFIDWCKYFFNNEKNIDKTTICEEYNSRLKDSMNSDESVRVRFESMYNNYRQYIQNLK